MSTHILFLNILILISTAFSTIFIQSIVIAGTGKELNETAKISKYIIIYYSIILISIGFSQGINIIRNLPIKFEGVLLLAIPIGFIVLFLEIIPELIKAKMGKYKLEIELSDKWTGEKNIILILVAIIALLEEIIFRGVWYEILVNSMDFGWYTFILLSSLFFGINHLGLGREVFLQKIISGICFSIIYVVSGNLLLVVLTHIIENIIIIGRYNNS